MTVLVLTCEEDVTADMVVAALHERGTRVVRLDPAGLPGEIALSGEYAHGDFHGQLLAGGRVVSMSRLRSIWIRRPGTPGARAAEQSAWITAESTQALYGMLNSTNALWMNHPSVAAQARYKPWQLHIAHRSGFAVPATLITTFPKMARQFASHHRELVVKSVSGSHPGDPPLALPTSRVDPDADFSGVAAGPTLLQQYVPKTADVRLTCVGRTLFAARKASDPSDPTQVDGRFTGEPDAWEPVEVPAGVERAVHAYMELTRLAYGAFDFAVDVGGTWWFLECNQSGQFGFIQLATGQPIAEAVADWLSTGTKFSGLPGSNPSTA